MLRLHYKEAIRRWKLQQANQLAPSQQDEDIGSQTAEDPLRNRRLVRGIKPQPNTQLSPLQFNTIRCWSSNVSSECHENRVNVLFTEMAHSFLEISSILQLDVWTNLHPELSNIKLLSQIQWVMHSLHHLYYIFQHSIHVLISGGTQLTKITVYFNSQFCLSQSYHTASWQLSPPNKLIPRRYIISRRSIPSDDILSIQAQIRSSTLLAM